MYREYTVRGFLKKESFDIKLVHKSEIMVGDLVLCEDDNIRTVCKKDIKNDSFMGISIFGSSYPKVKKVINYKS